MFISDELKSQLEMKRADIAALDRTAMLAGDPKLAALKEQSRRLQDEQDERDRQEERLAFERALAKKDEELDDCRAYILKLGAEAKDAQKVVAALEARIVRERQREIEDWEAEERKKRLYLKGDAILVQASPAGRPKDRAKFYPNSARSIGSQSGRSRSVPRGGSARSPDNAPRTPDDSRDWEGQLFRSPWEQARSRHGTPNKQHSSPTQEEDGRSRRRANSHGSLSYDGRSSSSNGRHSSSSSSSSSSSEYIDSGSYRDDSRHPERETQQYDVHHSSSHSERDRQRRGGDRLDRSRSFDARDLDEEGDADSRGNVEHDVHTQFHPASQHREREREQERDSEKKSRERARAVEEEAVELSDLRLEVASLKMLLTQSMQKERAPSPSPSPSPSAAERQYPRGYEPFLEEGAHRSLEAALRSELVTLRSALALTEGQLQKMREQAAALTSSSSSPPRNRDDVAEQHLRAELLGLEAYNAALAQKL